MLDLALSWAVIFLPFAFSIIFAFIPDRQEQERRYKRWRLWLFLFGILFAPLSWLQQTRFVKNAANDQEKAIERTAQTVSEKVVPKVASETSAKVTDVLNRQYGTVISELYQQLAEQNATGRSQLALNYKPSVDIIYAGESLQIWNRGRTNIYFHGDKYGDHPVSMNASPMVIVPNDNYYLLANLMNPYILRTVGQNGEARVPLELYLRTADGEKYIMHSTLWEVVKEGQITIHTQTHEYEKKDWSKQ
jgi:hypothetical protein